ncbi:MAG: PEP-CTERM sorting domain-containing protein [Planctomycetota bacterium]
MNQFSRVVLCVFAVASISLHAKAQFEIEFFERAVTQPDGQPVFLTDLDAAAAVDPGGVFDNGTSVSTCCGSFFTLNTIIGLSTDANAVTEGSQALNISMTNNNPGNQGGGNTAFDRPAILRITNTDPRYAGFETVAANPDNFKMVADITLIADEIPDTFSTDGVAGTPFVQVGFFQNSSGFVEPPELRDALSWGEQDLIDLEANGFSRQTIEFPAADLGLPTTSPTAYQIGFVFNGNWELGERAAFNIDNWRFEAAFVIGDLDLDMDSDLDADDFEILMANHLNPDADTLAEGDLDGDGDNDFDDFRIFEDGWNTLGGPVPFASLLAGVPEPSSLLLTLSAAIGGLAIRKRKQVLLAVVVVCVAASTGTDANAQLLDTQLFDWEGGLDGWDVSASDGQGVTLGNPTTGATTGATSLSIQQPLDGFNFGASTSVFGAGNVARDAFDEALDIGAENFVLELDVTYDSSFIPLGSFVNLSLRLSTGTTSGQVDSLALYEFASSPETITFSEPLSSWALPDQGGSPFYNFDLAINGDWGFSPATVFFDNMRLRQISEPALLTLEVNRDSGATRIVNNSTADGTGGETVEFNYYQVLSDDAIGPIDTEPDGDVDGADFLELQRSDAGLIADWQAGFAGGGGSASLDPTAWNSLDDQNIDASSGGSDTFDGWTASGGVSSAVAESNFLGSSDLADTESFSLGDLFTPGADENLQFFYREPGRPDFLREGNVVYVNTPAVSGLAAVPEASSLLLTVVAATGLGMCRRNR